MQKLLAAFSFIFFINANAQDLSSQIDQKARAIG
jgi:hypothetical protein